LGIHKNQITNLISLYSKVSVGPPRTFQECIKSIELQILINFFQNLLKVHLGHFGIDSSPDWWLWVLVVMAPDWMSTGVVGSLMFAVSFLQIQSIDSAGWCALVLEVRLMYSSLHCSFLPVVRSQKAFGNEGTDTVLVTFTSVPRSTLRAQIPFFYISELQISYHIFQNLLEI